MYIAQTSFLSFRAELSPELPERFAVFRHATLHDDFCLEVSMKFAQSKLISFCRI